jgi:transposase
MMDNLSVHRTAAVIDEVKQAGHDLLFRPPYSPDFAPVELAFGKK